MSETVEQEEIQITGSLLNITLFEDKIMKNFLIISNKLRKLETLFDVEQKQKALQKEFKFLTMKVENIVEKMPKDSGTLTRNDVKILSKETIYDLFNSNDDKIKNSKFHNDLMAEIIKAKDIAFQGVKDSGIKRDGAKTSFTAGQILRESEKEKSKEKEQIKIPKDSLQDVLDSKEMEIVTSIVENKSQNIVQSEEAKHDKLDDLTFKFDELTKVVEQLRLGRGYASYLEREAQKFQRFQKFQEKSRQTARKYKDRPIQLEGIKAENVKGEILKSGLLNEVQRMELNKEEIAKFELMQRKTFSSQFPKQQIKEFKDGKELSKGQKERDPYISSLKDNDKEKEKQKQKEGFRRSQSIRKLDKIEKRLRVDDLKDLNSVLRQIELRIQSKVTHDIFMGFIKDFEEKLEAIRIAKENNSDLSELRKNYFVLESKVQSVVSYLQSASNEDDALLVRKQWTCVSCDKNLEKYQGKVGQHLNWESISSKKISPNKAGAFGQTGQLAAKIRNLMEGNEVQD